MVHVKESHLFNRFAILLVEHQLPASLGHKDVVIGQYSHLRGLKELTGNQLLFHETLRIGRKLCLHVAIIELQVLANGLLCATQYSNEKTQLPPNQIGRAHVSTPVTNAQLLCHLPLEKKTKTLT